MHHYQELGLLLVKMEQNVQILYINMCVNLQNMEETALFSGKFYTADKNFTQPPF